MTQPPIAGRDPVTGAPIWTDPGTGERIVPPYDNGPNGAPLILARDPVTGSYVWRDPGTGEIVSGATPASAPAAGPPASTNPADVPTGLVTEPPGADAPVNDPGGLTEFPSTPAPEPLNRGEGEQAS